MNHFSFVIALALLAYPPPAQAGWGGGSCGPVGLYSAPVVVESGYRWQLRPDDPDAWFLLLNDQCVGSWRQSTNKYFAWLGNGWSEARECPVSPLPANPPVEKKDHCHCCGDDCNCSVKPCRKPCCRCVFRGAVVESDGTLNFGLDREAFGHAPKRVHNGREVSREQLLEAIAKSSVPNDANQLSLTVIGPESDRQRVLADLANSPTLAPWKGKLKIQGYDPDHWAVKDSGFYTDGRPTIYLQQASGNVLHRQDEYASADKLAEALRDADPAYDPKKDKNLNDPLSGLPSLESILAELQKVPTWVWLAAALLLYLRFGKKV